MALAIDHLFCFVDPAADWAERARRAGFAMDDGIEHVGQGTRNRRIWFPDQYLELVWLSSRADAEQNPLRLDRRADWRANGGCPFGIGLRGQLSAEQRAEFWAYHPPYAPEATIWIHRENADRLNAPFVFAMEATAEAIERYLPRNRLAATPAVLAHARPATLRGVELRLRATPPQLVLADVTPLVTWSAGAGPQRMTVRIGEAGSPPVDLTPELTLAER
jgi:hypothetical protein